MADDQPKRPPALQGPQSHQLSDGEVCRYIAEECVRLRQEARRPRLRMIGYLLDMVRLEAEKMAKDEGT